MKKASWLPVIVISVLIAVTLLIIIGYLIHLNKYEETMDVSDVFRIELLGTEGYGYVNVTVNPDFIEKTGISLSDFSYKVSKSNMLSNDEVIIITVDNAAGIKLSESQLKYTVAGLKDGNDLDIFKDLIIKYDADTKKLVLDNSQCSEFIKENVLFGIKRELSEYNKGDVVEIIGYVDMNAATDNRYNIISTTYEYIVE